MIARRIGAYDIECRLGAGGMGEVYLATDTRLRRKVAIKVLQREMAGSEDRVRRLTQEARAASALNHPNIVTVHELGEVDGVPYIVQELVEGETLRQRMSRGALPLRDAVDIATQIASALAAAHAAGIVHRDIKPENIMLRRDGLVKVLDFGLAKVIDEHGSNEARTATGVILGTVSYMSPEQARREAVDARSDVWSLGVVLYEMLSGFRPFDGPSISETLARVLHNEPQPLSVPPAVERIVTKMLTKDRNLRHADAGAVLQDLKSIPQARPGRMRVLIPIAAAVILVVWMAETTFRRPAAVDKTIAPAPVVNQAKSVAVLPFRNLSDDVNNEYLSDGVTEEVINALARVPNLKVVSRTSVFAFKGKTGDIRDVAKKLGVSTIVDGSVRKSGNRLRIAAELVNADDGYQVWSETYDRELSDVFAIQDQIAAAVAAALRTRLVPETRPAPLTRDLEAYEAYLKGRQASTIWNRESLEKAVSYFRLAIGRDPSFSQAWAGLADTYSVMDHRPGSTTLSSVETYLLAEEAANRALELDPKSAEAHAALGHIDTHTGRFADADDHLRTALQLNPNSGLVHVWYAVYLRTEGRLREAKQHFLRARELDPYSAFVSLIGATLWYYGDYETALEFIEHGIDLAPEIGELYVQAAHVYATTGRFKEAEAAIERAERAPGRPEVIEEVRAYVLAMEGRRAEAITLLNKIERDKRKPYYLVVMRAWAAAGDNESAIRALNRYVQATPYHARVNLDLPPHPAFKQIRDDPRYRKVRSDLGLPPIEVFR